MAKYSPNKYQQDIITASKTGTDGVVRAGAGTGKTSTFRMIAEANPTKKILYMAFNRGVADEAERTWKLSHVLCRNPHRLAYRPFAKQAQRRGGQYIKAWDLAKRLHIQGFNYKNGEGEDDTFVDSTQIAVAVGSAIARFCTSADTEITRYHVAGSDTVRNMPEEHQDKFIAHVLPYVQAAWKDIADPNGTLPFLPGRGDGCYLKLWSLSDPQLYFDIILYDEAQDANPAVAHVVEIQRNTQKIMVGDSAQAIYGWNGAVDAMKKFKGDWELELPQSYRFGEAIAAEANRWLPHTESTLRIIGHDKINSEIKPLDWTTVTRSGDAYPSAAILCRTNGGVIEAAMQAQESGKQVAIAGGTKEIKSFCTAASRLQNNERVTHPELAGYQNWTQVQEAVQKGEADDIGMLVRLVDNYGVAAIVAVCDNSTKPEQADIMVSTAHKAKGLEWDAVKIHGDFLPPKEGADKISVPEAMLIYVAITRAKKHLDNGALAWLTQFEQDINERLDEEES